MPDIWLLPNQVWEISADKLTQSPTYQMSIDEMKTEYGEKSKGLSLRFPRFIRARDDKSLNKITEFRNKNELTELNLKNNEAF